MKVNGLSSAGLPMGSAPAEVKEAQSLQPLAQEIADRFVVGSQGGMLISGVTPAERRPHGEVIPSRYVYETGQHAAERLAAISDRATGIHASLRQALQRLDVASDSLKEILADSPNGEQAEAAGQAVIEATETLATLRVEQATHLAAIAAEITAVQQVKRQLVSEIDKAPEAKGPPLFRNPKDYIDVVSADLEQTRVALAVLESAQKTLNALPIPWRGLADVNWALSGSFGAALPGVVSVAVDGGLRVGQENRETGNRPVYPFAAVVGATPVGSGFYMASAEPGRTGPGFSTTVVPYTSMGWSAANGRTIGLSVPGLFALNLRERGEVALNLSFPISPFLRAGFVTVAGHPMLNTAIAPMINITEGATFQAQEWLAGLQVWVRAQLAVEEGPQG